jgi:hypothetical protein
MLEKRITILFQISRSFIGSNPDILQQYKESVALHTTQRLHEFAKIHLANIVIWQLAKIYGSEKIDSL